MISEKLIHRAEALIEALPFLQRYRGQTFLIKFGGSAMEENSLIGKLIADIVFLATVGILPILVHGGGKAITARMREAGLRTTFINGLRVTDEESIRLVETVLDNEVNAELVDMIQSRKGAVRGISGKTVFRGVKTLATDDDGKPVDLGFVGEVTSVNLDPVRAILAEGKIPVVSPLAVDPEGRTLNVNADTAAAALAKALKVSQLVFISDVPGLMRDPTQADTLISTVNLAIVERLTKEKVITGGMIPKVESAVDALESGVGKVHFIDGRVSHALLLELFTQDRIGTEIVA